MATVTLEAVADTQIREFSPDSNFGESSIISVGVGSSARRRGLIKFDLSSIPSTATIVSATLSLYCLQIPFGSTDPATKIHRSLVEWFEGSGGLTGSTPVPGTNASTWNYRNHNGSIAWGGGAGGAAGSDWVSTAEDSQDITAGEQWYDWDVTSSVASFVEDGETNHGWWIINGEDTDNDSFKSFVSSNDSDRPEQQPKLVVEYFENVQTTILQPGPTGTSDTSLHEGIPNGNSGLSISLFPGWDADAQLLRRALLKFDLSSIPNHIHLIAARLKLYNIGTLTQDPVEIGLYRSLVQWYEGSGSGTTPEAGIDASTWNYRNHNGSVAWEGGAGGGAGDDFESTATDTTIVGPNNRWYEWDVTEDIKDWIQGNAVNYGWWILASIESGEDTTVKAFTSANDIPLSSDNRPQLVLYYINPSIEGTASGSSTATGTMQTIGVLAGTTAGESAVDALLRSNEWLVGTSQGQASTTGRLIGLHHGIGTASSIATVSGIIRGDIEIAGSAAGLTTHIADIKGIFLLAAAIAGTSTTSATPDFQGLMRGAIAGLATISAVGYAKATGKATVIGCNPVPLLYITDGTVKPNGQLNLLNLLSEKYGYKLRAYRPSVAQYKEGGRFSSSPLSQGRRLTFRTFDNAVDVFELTATGHDQDYLIEFQQELIAFQEAAADYWISNWTANPIYLVARAARETNTRYAIIHAMSIAELPNPYTQPFFNHGQVSFDTLTLRVERGHWLSTPPGEFECVEISSIRSWTVSGWESGS